MTAFARSRVLAGALWLALAFLLDALTLAVPAAAQVTTSASDHGTFGRIVFDWQAPVRHSAHLSGRSLTIRFNQPISGSLIAIRRNLPAYVDEIAIADDAKAITVALTGKFAMCSFAHGNLVVIELRKAAGIPRARAARPTTAPIATTARPGTLPTVAVRTGRHDGYGRRGIRLA